MAQLGLRQLLLHQHMVDGGHLAGDDGRAGVEIDVSPLQSEAFASPAPRRGQKDPRRQVAAVGDVVEEPAELVAAPCLRPGTPGCAHGRSGGGIGDVAGYTVPAHGVL